MPSWAMIIRTPKNKENPYVMINKGALLDVGLSFKAKGLLAYLLSLPNDWKIRPKELQKHAKDGRDAIYSGLQELIETGYLVKEQSRKSSGKFRQVSYMLYEVPLLLSNRTASAFPVCGDNVFEINKFQKGERGNIDDPNALEKSCLTPS
jgi:hypothetical protein